MPMDKELERKEKALDQLQLEKQVKKWHCLSNASKKKCP
jgi:hypothetical protein